jgi:tight adherence protein B
MRATTALATATAMTAGAATALLVLAGAMVVEAATRARRGLALTRRLGAAHPRRAPDPRVRLVPPPAPPWFVAKAQGLGLTGDPAVVLWSIVAVSVLALVVAVVAGGWELAALVVVALLATGWFLDDFASHRAEREIERDLPAILDAVSDAVRSGSSLAAALTEAALVARGVALADLQVTIGAMGQVGVATALHEWGERRRAPGVRLAVAALSLAAELGGSAQPIDGVAATLRERMAAEREARALSAQARSSAAVIILAPIAFVALMAMADDTVVPFFLHTSLGFACVVGGAALDGAGAWWMLRILRSAS